MMCSVSSPRGSFSRMHSSAKRSRKRSSETAWCLLLWAIGPGFSGRRRRFGGSAMQHSLAKTAMEGICAELSAYLTGEQSLREFYEWFATETWDVHLWAPVQVQRLVYNIKSVLAEYDLGHWSEAQLKTKLRPFVTSVDMTSTAARG